jgi:hypothetical protein
MQLAPVRRRDILYGTQDIAPLSTSGVAQKRNETSDR